MHGPHLTVKEWNVSLLALRPNSIIGANVVANFDGLCRLYPLSDCDVPYNAGKPLK